jgi:hypothetical protein
VKIGEVVMLSDLHRGHEMTAFSMCVRRAAPAVLLALFSAAGRIDAQVPAALRAAMHARDSAVYNADAATWSKYTTDGYTTVQQDGSRMTKAERVANLRSQTPKPYQPRMREQNTPYGNAFVARFYSSGLWLLEVWVNENGAWKVAESQATFAKK